MAFAIIRRGYARAHSAVTSPKFAAMRAKAKERAEDMIEAAAVVAGGAVAGYVEGEWPDKEVMGVNAGLVLGAALTVAGMMNWAGRSSHIAGSVGEGILAYEAGRRVRERAA